MDQTKLKSSGARKWFKRVFGVIAIMLVVLLIGIKLIYGGGKPYPDISTNPRLSSDQINAPIQMPYPPGMVASSPSGRIFYTYHMLHKPERFADATIFEWVNGEGIPFPNTNMQAMFHGAMGITIDGQERLWVIKPGALEGKPTRLLAIDMKSGALLVDHAFALGVGGMAQDLRVSPDGRTVYLADTGVFKFTKANLIVYDVQTDSSHTVLKGHPSVSPQNWVLRKTNGKPYRLALGLLTFSVGVDGIALTQDGKWLYYATMSHDSVYRIPTNALRDKTLSVADIEAQIEFIGYKPMSDGIELLADNTVIITDVENGGLSMLSPDGTLTTLTKDKSVDWADSVTVSPDGAIWFTDSRLTDLINQFAVPSGREGMLQGGPYAIYRIKPEAISEWRSQHGQD